EQTNSKGNGEKQNDDSDFVVPVDISHWGYTNSDDDSTTIRASFSSTGTTPPASAVVPSITLTPQLPQTPTLKRTSTPGPVRSGYIPYTSHSLYYRNRSVPLQQTGSRYPSRYLGHLARSTVLAPFQSPASPPA